MTEDWIVAFIALARKNNGVALANLLRRVVPNASGGTANLPIEVVYHLAEFCDPRLSFNVFAKPPSRSAVKFTVSAVSRSHLNRIRRDQGIWGEVMMLFNKGQSTSDAAISVGEKYGLSERRVTEIWSAARHAFSMLDLPRETPRKLTRRHVR